MPWLLLIVAGVLETGWTVAMKYSHGLTRPAATGVAVVASIASFVLLSQAMRDLPMGTAYAVWTGIGAVGSVVLGILIFHEPVNAPRMICLALVIAGVVGLNLFSRPGTAEPAAALAEQLDADAEQE